MSEYDNIGRHQLEMRLRIAEAKLCCLEEANRHREKEAEFQKEFNRCKEFLETNGFVVMRRTIDKYEIV